MKAELRNALSEVLDTRQQQGWLALFARERLPLRRFGSRRIGKLLPDGELHFSLGATAKGMKNDLNKTIEQIIRSEGLVVLDRYTTSGSRNAEARYPAFQTAGLNAERVVRIVHLVEGAALQCRS